MEGFHYTYVLLCSDDKFYIGSASDLQRRISEHESGNVSSTNYRRPVKLIYYEACLSKRDSQAREKYFKTGFGRAFLKRRIYIPR